MRISKDEIKNGVLYTGYDYKNQAWVSKGKYVKCGHGDDINCGCYGKAHENEACKIKGE